MSEELPFKKRQNLPGACRFKENWNNLFTFELYFYESASHRKVEPNRKHYPYFNFIIRNFGSSVQESIWFYSEEEIDVRLRPFKNSMEEVKKNIYLFCVDKSREKLFEILDKT